MRRTSPFSLKIKTQRPTPTSVGRGMTYSKKAQGLPFAHRTDKWIARRADVTCSTRSLIYRSDLETEFDPIFDFKRFEGRAESCSSENP
jgi:hypothetical protein